jgi:hypothetical protein
MIVIKKEDYFFINTVEDITTTHSNSLVVFEYDEKLISYCKDNYINYAIIITNIKELILSANSGARYLLTSKKSKLKKYQKIVEHYMYDSRLLFICNNINKIKFVAKNRIDGIFIKGVNK